MSGLGFIFVAGGYYLRSKRMFGSNLIAYWPLWEASGSVATNFEGTSARDGTYHNCTLAQPGIGDNKNSAEFDGTNSYIDIYSASLNTAFDGQEGSLMMWLYVPPATWLDATVRYAYLLYVDANNFLYYSRWNESHELAYVCGGSWVGQTIDPFSSAGWYHFACTWSLSEDVFHSYFDGIEISEKQNGLLPWAGNLSATKTLIGAFSNVPADPWKGKIAHVVLLDKAATKQEIDYMVQGY